MKSLPVLPLEPTELRKLAAVLPVTKVAKIAIKSGTSPDTFLIALSGFGITRQALHHGLRFAGHRTRKVRSDRGVTLKTKLEKLLAETKQLQEELSQKDNAGSPGSN